MLKDKFIQKSKLLKDSFLSQPWTKDKYASWLAQQYFLVSHTPRLLVAYGNRTSNPQEFKSIVHHINEERGHDLWIVSDLKNLGYDIKDFKPFEETNLLIKALYHDIDRVNPRALYGYSLLLEQLSVDGAGEFAQIIESQFGKNCTKFLRGHADVDVGHTKEAFETLKMFSEADNKVIEETLNYSTYTYMKIYDKLSEPKTNKFAA